MKRITKILTLILVMAIVLCGCTKKNEETKFSYGKGLDKNGFWEGIKATDYVTLVSYKDYQVPEKDINEEIDRIMSQEDYMKKLEIMDRAIEMYDEVNIDYIGKIDGVEFSGGSTGGYGTDVVIGVTNYIDDFLEQLVGHMPGESLNVEVTFPEDYGNAECAGKNAVFETKINYIVGYEQYELSDDFVMGVLYDGFGWKTVGEMKAGIKGYLVENYLFDNSTFKDEMPEIVRNQYVDRMLYELEQTAKNYGLDAETYIGLAYASYGISSMEDFKAGLVEAANDAAQNYMLFQAVAEVEGIKVSDDDLLQYYEDNGMGEHVAEALSFYGEPFIKSMALYQKVSESIRDTAK